MDNNTESRLMLDISKPAKEFKEHLELPNNIRIVFIKYTQLNYSKKIVSLR